MNATEIFVYGAAWTAIWGLIVWFGKDKISNSRDRKKSAQRFLGFLEVWKDDVERNVRICNSVNVVVPVSGRFNETRSQLIEKANELELNYRGKARTSFREVYVKTITDMTAGAIDSEEGRQKLVDAIQNLAAFVRKN